jgi:hypothetical protein
VFLPGYRTSKHKYPALLSKESYGYLFVCLQIPLPIKNFTTDWNDGRALGALVDSVAPGLTPDWVRWKPVDRVPNTRTAMDKADEYLGVPKVSSTTLITHAILFSSSCLHLKNSPTQMLTNRQ